MSSNSSTLPVKQPQMPVLFKGDSYEIWSIKMKTFLWSEGLWDFVETGYAGASDDKFVQEDNQKQDAKALLFIQQAVDESIFSSIAVATSAKQAWSILKTEYQGSKKDLGHGDVVQNILECLKKIGKPSKQLSPSIYMVPNTFKDESKSCFNPRIVSIGPLHRKDEKLQASEGDKVSYVRHLLNRLGSKPEEILKACAHQVNAKIDTIRSCYAVKIDCNDTELTKMMVMDGCFILEFLYQIKKNVTILGNMMFVQFTMYDLLLLENQIPLFVLEDIFECTISKFDQKCSLLDIIHAVLEDVNPFKDHKLQIYSDVTHRHHHILHLLHECYQYKKAETSKFSNSRFPSAVELDRSRVKFKRARDTDWPLVMEVKLPRLPCFPVPWGNPTLIMPALEINDFTELVLRNLIVYEQFSEDVHQYITSYAMAIDMLVDSEDDIAKLTESKVLVNNIGSNQEAAVMINKICKEVAWRDFLYSDQWKALNHHYKGYWSKNMAWFRPSLLLTLLEATSLVDCDCEFYLLVFYCLI